MGAKRFGWGSDAIIFPKRVRRIWVSGVNEWACRDLLDHMLSNRLIHTYLTVPSSP